MPSDTTRESHRCETRTIVNGTVVRGVLLDAETRCRHYDSARDVVAIQFHCCLGFFACHRCHAALVNHDASQWPVSAFGTPAVLCGRCGATISIRAYLEGDNACPACGGAFNPGCRAHAPHYFAKP